MVNSMAKELMLLVKDRKNLESGEMEKELDGSVEVK